MKNVNFPVNESLQCPDSQVAETPTSLVVVTYLSSSPPFQNAGSQLKEVVKALKNPLANPGMLLGKAVEKTKRSMGVVAPAAVDGAHAELAAEADKLGTSVALFGGSVEDLLTKYQKKIIGKV